MYLQSPMAMHAAAIDYGKAVFCCVDLLPCMILTSVTWNLLDKPMRV